MSLDDLSDQPLDTQPVKPLTPRPLSPDVADYVEYLDGLCDDDTVGYAVETLQGIRRTVKETNRVTQGQRNAVQNIVSGGHERQGRFERGKGSRRYEGFGR